MNLNKKNKLFNILLIIAIIITCVGFIVDFKNTLTYWGNDLRNRVVGARLAIAGIEPYFFDWHPGLSERFLDPIDPPGSFVSRLTVPPTVLALHSVIARFAYLPQKLIWLVFQWSLFLGTVLVFIKKSNFSANTNSILALSFFLLTVSFGAFMSIQVKYTFYT